MGLVKIMLTLMDYFSPADRCMPWVTLTLGQRRVVASLMEVCGLPTVVRQKFAERFAGQDPPSRLTIYRVYAKFVKTGSVADNYRGNEGWPRTGRSDLNIAVVQQATSQSPSKLTTRCSLETGILQKTVWRILPQDLRMRPYHIQVVQALTAVQNVFTWNAARC